tara:strand:- start:106 stop:960 length:855 start_codon:yes stop_codon:yes gene_type:complete
MDKKLSAMVVLSLAMLKVKRNRNGKVPSLEELAALYDGNLSDKRRAQVLYHLREDNDLYSQWLLIVESAEHVGSDDNELIVDRVIKTHKQSISKIISDYFNDRFLVPAFTICMIPFLAIILLFNQKVGLNDLYLNYATNGQSLVSLPTRSYFENNDLPASAEYKFIRAGYDNGLVSLNLAEAKKGSSDTEPTAVNRDSYTEQQALYFDLGELAAIVDYQCQGFNEQFFFDATQVLDSILEELGRSDNEFSKKLSQLLESNLETEQSLKSKLCGMTQLITNKNYD